MGLQETEHLYSCTCQHWLMAAFGDVDSRALPGLGADRQSALQPPGAAPCVKKQGQVVETMCENCREGLVGH